MAIYRRHCSVRKVDLDTFELTSFNPRRKWRINTPAMLAWYLIDGNLSRDLLGLKLSRLYDEVSLNEAIETIDSLIEKKLAGHQDYGRRHLKEINVCIVPALTSSTDDTDSVSRERYTLFIKWLLWNTFETVTYIEELDKADLAFYIERNVTPNRDESTTFNILCSDAINTHDVDQFDYLISKMPATGLFETIPYSDRWMYIPPVNDITAIYNDELLSKAAGVGFSINRLACNFASFLLAEQQEILHDRPDSICKLTIGMATFDDYDGVYFSVTSMALHHQRIFEKSEIIVLDNNPGGPVAAELKKFCKKFPNLKYIPYKGKVGTSVRDRLFTEASGEWVLCLDSHVMFVPGALDKLYTYVLKAAEPNQFLQGPLVDDNAKVVASHFKPTWEQGFYGKWALDSRATNPDNPPFEIEMQGLGVFVCRKDFWPGFNQGFRGFGGEEGYIHQKIRNKGGICLCLPFLGWAHRFGRPLGAKYPLNWQDRVHNYFVGFTEVGLDMQVTKEHFKKIGMGALFEQEEQHFLRGEHSPFNYFDQIFCINLDNQPDRFRKMTARFEKLAIASKVERISAVHTPENHHLGCALSHRKAVQLAADRGLESVLVFEDDALLISGADVLLGMALQQLENKEWDLLFLGGTYDRSRYLSKNNGLTCIEMDEGSALTSTQAIVYHRRCYDKILNSLPEDYQAIAEWANTNHAIDQFLKSIPNRFVVYPDIAQQQVLLQYLPKESLYDYS